MHKSPTPIGWCCWNGGDRLAEHEPTSGRWNARRNRYQIDGKRPARLVLDPGGKARHRGQLAAPSDGPDWIGFVRHSGHFPDLGFWFGVVILDGD